MKHKKVKAQEKISCQVLLVLLCLTCFLVSNGQAETYQFVLKWGSQGSGDGQFGTLRGVAVDTSGYVYVTNSNRIHKFDSQGTFISKWGSAGIGNGQCYLPLCFKRNLTG